MFQGVTQVSFHMAVNSLCEDQGKPENVKGNPELQKCTHKFLRCQNIKVSVNERYIQGNRNSPG